MYRKGIKLLLILYSGLLSQFIAVSAAYAQQPSPEALLTLLRAIDSMYSSHLTASGTYFFFSTSSPPIPPTSVAWQLSSSPIGEVAYQNLVSEVKPSLSYIPAYSYYEYKGAPWMAFKTVIYKDTNLHGMYSFMGLVPETDTVIKSVNEIPFNSTAGTLRIDTPQSTTFLSPMKTTVLSMGRGFSEYLSTIDSITTTSENLILIRASGTNTNKVSGYYWSIYLDPACAYMARKANMSKFGESAPEITMNNAGNIVCGSFCAPTNAEWRDLFGGGIRVYSYSIKTLSSTPDRILLDKSKRALSSPYPVHTDSYDYRTNPTSTAEFNAGAIYSKVSQGELQSEKYIRNTTPIASKAVGSISSRYSSDTVSHAFSRQPIASFRPYANTQRFHYNSFVFLLVAGLTVAILLIYICLRHKNNANK